VTGAAALKLARAGKIRAGDELVLCIAGNGLKTIEKHALPPAPT